MKSIKPSVKEIFFSYSEESMWNSIEYAARVCYDSLSGMGKTSSKDWVCNTIIPKGHGRALEFGSVYLRIPCWRIFSLLKYRLNHYSKVTHWNCVTTNYRVLCDHGWEKDLRWWGWTGWHKVRRMLHWTISRGIADEFRTHCSISSLMSSTRYILMSSKRHGGEVTFVRPYWYEEYKEFLDKMWSEAEQRYMEFVYMGCQAQQAREALPLSIKAEFVQCAYEDDWKGFCALRAEDTEHNHPHPDALYIASEAKQLLFG